MEIFLYVGLMLIFFSVFAIIFGVLNKEESLAARLEKELIYPLGKQQKKTKKLHSFLAPLTVVTKKLDGAWCGGLRRKLATAGTPFTVAEFFAVKLLSVCLACGFGLVILPTFLKGKMLLFLLLFFVFGLILPELWLSDKLKKRQREIARDLPPVIDLLNLCVGAGLDFMQAVKKVIKNFRKCNLTDELQEMNREIDMGTSRHDALKNMSWRINLPEVSSFVRTLVQTDKMGAPIKETLGILSEEIKIRRFQKGEEQAMKAPVKLLIPLIIFILPVVMAIVAGPIILNFIGGGGMKAF